MAHSTPQVNDTILTLSTEGQKRSISIGSVAWWQWLSDEGTTTFHMKSVHGSFTARREQKGGSCYWYAYRKHRGRLHKAYLGKNEEIGQARLEEIAAQLTVRIATVHQSDPATGVELDKARGTKAKGASSPPYNKQAPATAMLPARRISGPLYAQDRLQSPLLATKFYLPPARADLVARPRLIERLANGLQRKLTLVAAPAGFGKTTLLSNWQATARVPYAWLALDAGDNDPVRFWTYVAVALRSICPTVQDKITPLLQMIPLPPIESLLTILINECTAQNIILILDDYHLIATQAIHDGIQFLLEHLPPRMHIVLVSRGDPPLPLTKLRARGELTEIRAQDLRFTPDEATAFLNSVIGLQLSDAEIAALDAHTEGWAAGLQLAALSIQGRRDQTGARDAKGHDLIAFFTGSHRFILDYLTDEVLQQQPEHVRAFLLSTSLLDRLNAQLCNALTGQNDGQAMLERLERANLFLIPLDEERHWYRYHHLFAEFLRARLQQEQPSLMPQLHRKAARWYEQHDLLTEAVEHALAAPDLAYAAQLLDKVSQLMHMRGEVMTLLHWLSQLPQEAISARPELRLFQAAAYMGIGQLDTAEGYHREIEQTLNALRQRPDQDPIFLQRLEGELIGSRSVLAAFRGDLPRTIELSRLALQILPEENAFLRSVVAMGIGNAYLLTGDFTRASEAFAEVVKTGMLAQNMHCVLAAVGGQGYIEAARGHLHQALATHRRAIQLGTEHGGYIFPIISMSYIYLAYLYYEWNDLETAERYVRDGIELGKQWGYVGTLATGYYILARIQLLKGMKDEALAIMQQSRQMVQSFHMQMVVTMAAANEAWIQLKASHGEAAAQWARTCGLSEHALLTHPREVEHLVLSEILINQGRYVEALAIVERLLPMAEAAGWGRSTIECLLLQAIILEAQGQLEQTLHVLARAFSLTEPEGYIRVFLDKGPPMIKLLRHAVSQGVAHDYARRLLRAAGIVDEEHPGVLSERELLVLRSIATGKSNQQIASDFVVALSTVKTHLNNIYMKLGVHSRTQAIVRARELHLLA